MACAVLEMAVIYCRGDQAAPIFFQPVRLPVYTWQQLVTAGVLQLGATRVVQGCE